MLEDELFQEVSTAAFAPPSTHPLFEAIEQYGIRSQYAASWLGIAQSTYSLYYTGRVDLPQKHLPQLIDLVRRAKSAAGHALGQMALRKLNAAEQVSFDIYRLRVQRAAEILENVDGSSNG